VFDYPTVAALSEKVWRDLGGGAKLGPESDEDENEAETAAMGVVRTPRGGRAAAATAAAVTVMVTGGAWPLVPFSAHLQPAQPEAKSSMFSRVATKKTVSPEPPLVRVQGPGRGVLLRDPDTAQPTRGVRRLRPTDLRRLHQRRAPRALAHGAVPRRILWGLRGVRKYDDGLRGLHGEAHTRDETSLPCLTEDRSP
jgi:hypothetical protein